MSIYNPRRPAPMSYSLALLVGASLAAWPLATRAETETPPPSRLRDPLSGVARFLGHPSHEKNQSGPRFANLPRHENRIRVARKATPTEVYGYAYVYAPYYYPYALMAWPRYPYRGYAYYYSPIPGYAVR